MSKADFTYDRKADCFVVTDDKGNEICRTRSPHDNAGKFSAASIVDWVNAGTLIFPTTKPE